MRGGRARGSPSVPSVCWDSRGERLSVCLQPAVPGLGAACPLVSHRCCEHWRHWWQWELCCVPRAPWPGQVPQWELQDDFPGADLQPGVG